MGDIIKTGFKISKINDQEKQIKISFENLHFFLQIQHIRKTWLPEEGLKALGANFIGGPAWSDSVQVDGKLVTGQNPNSGTTTGKRIVELLL